MGEVNAILRVTERRSWVGLVVFVLSVVGLCRVDAQTSQWTQFRGPGGDGVAHGLGLPDRWSVPRMWRG